MAKMGAMDLASLDAITDLATLRALVREQVGRIGEQARALAERERTLREHERLIDTLKRQLAWLNRQRFGARSERMDGVQRELFEEAMAADIAAVEAELEAAQAASTPERAPRAKPRRRSLPPDLPRITTTHEPAQCECAGCGAALVRIGEHVSEKLDVKPAEFFVRREVYPQYACRACETVVAEVVAPAIIDRGLAAPGLLAEVAIRKYVDHLPLYRQEAIYARHGIELPRNLLADWIGRIGFALQPLVDALKARLLACPILHADETPVAELDPGAGKTHRAYLFAYRSCAGPPIVVFDYCPSRAGRHARAFLGDWRGALMVDDYSGYDALFTDGITELACWAHARRKFFDAHAASASPIAQAALERINALYALEAKLRDLDEGERQAMRQRHLVPAMAALKVWLEDLQPRVLGNSGLARAIAYTLKRWPALARVAEDGRYPFDNNPVENAIRPIALGRKNWLFAGSRSAGQRAAAIMSLLATAKANGIEPHAWLTNVLTHLPITLQRDIDTLLPIG
mgnify:CR=1 FL=1